ncbi:MAG: hypothetical protein Q8L28_00905 [bacterium]|nr:hypothetical protein [bacterium]
MAEGIADGELVGVEVAFAVAAGVALAEAVVIGVSVGIGTKAGQASNSQFGPVLPTADPSEQTFASAVQVWGVAPKPKYFGIKKYAATEMIAAIISKPAIIGSDEDFFGSSGGTTGSISLATSVGATTGEGFLRSSPNFCIFGLLEGPCEFSSSILN